MQHRAKITMKFATIALASASALALGTLSLNAQTATYRMTVNKERLLNAQNEPQLTQINRDNVKELRLVWAMALGGMQDVRQNGPEAEVNPLIDNGFMYVIDGWGGLYKIDARAPNKGDFVWANDFGVRHEGFTPLSRGFAMYNDLLIAPLADGRMVAVNRDSGEVVWDKMIMQRNEFGTRERFRTAPIVAEDKVIIANGAGDAGTRGWLAALDVKTGNEL